MRRRSAWGALICAAALAIGSPLVAQATGAHNARHHAPRPARIVLPLPSAGDVTYGVAQVRIDRRTGTLGRGGRTAIFRSRFGGLSVAARSASWPALRRTMHVYVVVSRVAGGNPALRNVAFFVVRRLRGARGPRAGSISFTVSNAHAQTSYWVHGVDRHGVARIFVVRNILSTSIRNWSRYLGVLHLAKALTAALHPVDLHGEFAAKRKPVRRRASQLWTGGARMDSLTREVYALIFGTLDNHNAYQAAKRSPLVTQFITKELGNARLAAQWKRIVAALPLAIPDRYAAAAQEESRFAPVTSPRISSKRVVIADSANSTTEGEKQTPASAGPPPPSQLVVLLPRTLPVEVLSSPGTTPGPIQCGGARIFHTCSAMYTSGQTVTLFGEGSASHPYVATWRGCDSVFLPGSADAECVLHINATRAGTRRIVRVSFKPLPPPTGTTHLLRFSTSGPGSGTVSSNPPGISCSALCYGSFSSGQYVTLTATPASGSTVASWTGCDGVSGNTCGVNMYADRSVNVTFGLAPTPAPSRAGTLDTTFGGDGSVLTATGAGSPVGGVTGIVRQSDGKLVTVATGTSGGATVTYVARYLHDGSLDTSFGSAGVKTVPNPAGKTFLGRAVTLDGSGDIVVAGGLLVNASPGEEHFGVVRLTSADGSLDSAFDGGSIADTPMGNASTPSGEAEGVVVDGSTIYAGGFTTQDSKEEFALAAYKSDGTLETAFGGTGKVTTAVGTGTAQINGMTLDNGTIVAAGFAQGASNLETAVAEYDTGGGLDAGYNGGSPKLFAIGADPGTDSGAYSVLAQPSDDRIVVGGFGVKGGAGCMGFARLNTDGTSDASFGNGGAAQVCTGDDATADGLALDANGLYAGGYVYNGARTVMALARLTGSGSLDTSFGGTGVVTAQPTGSGESAQGNALVLDGADPVVAGYAYTAGAAPNDVDSALVRYFGQ